MSDHIFPKQNFDTPQDALAHYGVKGMRWGVRKDEETGGRTNSGAKKLEFTEDEYGKAMDSFYSKKTKEELQAEGKRKLQAQVDADRPPKVSDRRNAKADKMDDAVRLNEEYKAKLIGERDALGDGFLNRMKKSSYQSEIDRVQDLIDIQVRRSEQLRSGKLTREQKTAIAIGSTVAITGLAIYGTQKYQDYQLGLSGSLMKQYEAKVRAQSEAEWQSMFGEIAGFQSSGLIKEPTLMDGSAFFAGLTSKRALMRPEFEIPEGTIFQRLSDHKEDISQYGKDGGGVYSTFLTNDKKLYGSSMEFGGKKHTVNFKATPPTRVPALTTVLGHLSMAMAHDAPGITFTPEQIFSAYHGMSGGSWDSPIAKNLFRSLKESGYSAIVDDMDAGYLGDLPVVFFGDAHSGAVSSRTALVRRLERVGLSVPVRKYS